MNKDKNTRKYVSCTAEVFEQVLENIRGGITLGQLVDLNKDNPEFPSQNAIRAFITADSARMKAYTYAREIGSDALADSTIEIADNVRDAAHAANRIKARQWLASKMKPKMYGDKLDVDITGRVDVAGAILSARHRAKMIDVTPPVDALTNTNTDTIIEQAIDPFS